MTTLVAETNLEFIFDALETGVILYEPIFPSDNDFDPTDFAVSYCNKTIAEWSGLDIATIKQQRVLSLINVDEERRQILFEQIADVYKTGRRSVSTIYNALLNRHFQQTRNKLGKTVLAEVKDVTAEVMERKECERQIALANQVMNFIDIMPGPTQERKVQEEADQFSRIVDASLNAIYVWKAIRNDSGVVVDFEYKLVNKTFEKINGLSTSEVIGKTALQLYPSLKGTDLFKRYVGVIETGEPIKFEDYYKGEELDMWFEASAVKLSADEVFISYRDITGQKLAAMQLQEQNALLDSILTNSPSGIVVVRMIRDERGTIVDGQAILMNDAAERYTQYPKTIMLTKTSMEMEPHILESPVYQNVIRMMETGEPFHIEYQMEMTGRWVYMNVAKIDDDHLVNVFTDITDSKNYHLEQERMLHELKRSNSALEEFARAASHDLKEPIRKVQFFLGRLKDDLAASLAPQQVDLFNRIEKASNRMRALVEDLLEYSHLSTSIQEKENIDLNENLQSVLYDLELLIKEKKAVITVGHLPTINGYQRQLQQAFQNLITNALTYSRQGVDPHIDISATMVTGKDSGFNLPVGYAEHSFHLIRVADNGIGFEPENAERIFDVFTRLHGNSEYPGTGIGLSIVKKVAENHSGFVVAEGQPNAGASFLLLFPV